MIKYDELKQELDKVIELALVIKKNLDFNEEESDSNIKISDLGYTKDEKPLLDYLNTLSDEKVHALMTIMYIGRDGISELDNINDDILDYYMKTLNKDEKDIEISMMLEKFTLYDYLINGRTILNDR